MSKFKKHVIVKHLQDGGKYLFWVPKRVSLEAGDYVVCDTARGRNQLGICCCDSFMADPEEMCKLFGTQISRMKYVTGMVSYDKFDPDDEEDGEE
jgi:hypothetical protein